MFVVVSHRYSAIYGASSSNKLNCFLMPTRVPLSGFGYVPRALCPRASTSNGQNSMGPGRRVAAKGPMREEVRRKELREKEVRKAQVHC